MRIFPGIVITLALVSCANTSPISLDPEAPVSTHTFRCDNGWNDCYAQAIRICGARGFEELDRAQAERLTSSGRSVSPQMEPDTQRNDNRGEVESRVLTVRCR